MPLRAFVLIVWTLPLLAGCSPSKDGGAGSSKPFAGVSLTVAVPPQSGFAQAWDSLLVEWSARTGAEVKVIEAAASSLAANETQDSSGSASAEPVPALLVFPLTEASELVAAGRLAPLPRDVQGEDELAWNDMLPGLAIAVGNVERDPTIVPISSPVLVLYYRRDLLEKAGLTPPETWDDYQKLLETLDRWAPGLSAVEPWGEGFRATMFLARAAGAARPAGQYSFFFDIETGEPLADSPAFARTWEQSRAAIAKMPEDVVRLTPEDCRQRILAGEAALAIAYESPDGASGASGSESPRRKEGIQLGFAPLPGARAVYNREIKKWENAPGNVNRVGLTGFRGLGAGVSTAVSEVEAQAAWNLLSTLIAPGSLEVAFTGANRSPCRASQIASSAGWTGSELSSAEAADCVEAAEVVLRDKKLSAELPVPGAAEFRRRLTEALTSALKDERSAAETMSGLQESWREAAKTIGPDKLRGTYRRRLGLPAK